MLTGHACSHRHQRLASKGTSPGQEAPVPAPNVAHSPVSSPGDMHCTHTTGWVVQNLLLPHSARRHHKCLLPMRAASHPAVRAQHSTVVRHALPRKIRRIYAVRVLQGSPCQNHHAKRCSCGALSSPASSDSVTFQNTSNTQSVSSMQIAHRIEHAVHAQLH